MLVDNDNTLPDHFKLARLRECVHRGSAEELIMDILDGPESHQAAIQELDLWYGGTSRLVEQQEKEVLPWPKIGSERDGDKLKIFALKLRSVLVNLKSCGMQPGKELYLAATQKVPTSVLLRYCELHNDAEYDMQGFADWLMR